MRKRTILLIIVIATIAYVLPKTGLFVKVKSIAINKLTGNHAGNIKSVRVVVRPLSPEIENEGLMQESLQVEVEQRLQSGGIKVLSADEFENIPMKQILNVSVVANKIVTLDLYQYVITIDIAESSISENDVDAKLIPYVTIWDTSAAGEGDLTKIRNELLGQIDLFIYACTGKNGHASTKTNPRKSAGHP